VRGIANSKIGFGDLILLLRYFFKLKVSTHPNVITSSEDFISLEVLAQQIGLSRYAIIRLFKANVGLTPHAFQINLKINQARELLKQGISLAELAVNLGFSDQSHFHKAFKAHTGVTPRQFQLAAAQ
ncbi:helix-turn-helix transcriptional regulator, partial [Acinetobacter nosocomialis]